MNKTVLLKTKHGENFDMSAWEKHPRPSLVRGKWKSLNGKWHFKAQGRKKDEKFAGELLVPFCPESELSGVGKVFKDVKLLYRRDFSVPREWDGLRVRLNFGAVDQACEVYVNGRNAGSHKGGYTAFSFDITDYLNGGENTLEVRVIDRGGEVYPYAKQSYKHGGMWYTPVSGIWQSVWLEAVPEKYVISVSTEVTPGGVRLSFEGVDEGVVYLADKEINVRSGVANIDIEEPRLWSPQDPYLYYYTAVFGEDRISSYFAVRTLEVKRVGEHLRLCLNGKPYFFNGLLDQGYYPDGIYTPASPDCYEEDILMAKSLGYNTLRKHIKVEPDVFYYDCDRLGMIVFQDMVNNGGYNFIFDTAIPTIGLKKVNDRFMNNNKRGRRMFIQSMRETVKQLKSHPCICYWTIFNEGWGQFEADKMYDELKSLDDSRIIDSTSGWFKREKSDVSSQHIYFKKLFLDKSDKPAIISEFGGYSYKISGHSFNEIKTYGYRLYDGREDFVQGVRETYEEILELIDQGLCGAIFTQLSDVEDEVNGVVTYDRKILKLKREDISDIFEKIYEKM